MRVVLAIDGSSDAATATQLVARIRWPRGSAVALVSAVGDSHLQLGTWPTPGEAVAIDQRVRTSLGLLHDGVTADLVRAGLDVESVIAAGRPASLIADAARTQGADLVVVGSRGLGPIGSLLLGSVSAEVVSSAHVPVLVARRATVERVVLGIDGSVAARRAERRVASWPMFEHSVVIVVAVRAAGATSRGPGDPVTSERDVALERAAGQAASRLRRAGRTAVLDVRTGDPAAALLDAAAAWDGDLVVVGASGAGGPVHRVLGSVSRNVVTAAATSVLVVRHRPAGPASARAVPGGGEDPGQ